jgi:hypothetical protein
MKNTVTDPGDRGLSPFLIFFLTPLLALFIALPASSGVCLAQNIRDFTISDFHLGETGESIKERLLAKDRGFEFFDIRPRKNVEKALQVKGFAALLRIDRKKLDCHKLNCPVYIEVFTTSDDRVWRISSDEHFAEGETPKLNPFYQNMASTYGSKPYFDGTTLRQWLYDEKGDFIPWKGPTSSNYDVCEKIDRPESHYEIDKLAQQGVVTEYLEGCHYEVLSIIFRVSKTDNVEFSFLQLSDLRARREDLANEKQQNILTGNDGDEEPDTRNRRNRSDRSNRRSGR